MNFLKTLTFLLCLLLLSFAFAIAQDNTQNNKKEAETTASSLAPPQETQSPQWNFNPHVATVETTLSAFTLRGPRRIDKITDSDFDVLISKEGKRLIPLLRLLRFMLATGRLEDNILTFEVESGPGASINLNTKNMKVQDQIIPLDIVVGISDVTNKGEIYVSEEILKHAFGWDFSWSDDFYEYSIQTEDELEIFIQRRPKSVSAFSIKVKEVLEPLPETEPPAYPKETKPLLSFFETNLRADVNWRWRNKTKTYETSGLPSLTAWGRLFGGDYEIKIRNRLVYPDTEFPKLPSWLDRGIWTQRKTNHIVNIGDTNIGLSDLVVPSASLFGTSFKWLSHVSGKEEAYDRFFKSRAFSFLSFETIEGIALLNSTVELWVNNRLIDTKIVEEIYDAPPGYGTYRFREISLLDRTINEIKIVVRREDGIIEEFYREIVGTSQLLPKGEWAVLGGMGTDRQEVDEEIKTKGFLSGMQVYHGVSEGLTLGLSAAVQDKFAFLEYNTGETGRETTSYFIAQQAKYKLFDKFLLTGDLGKSFDTKNSSTTAYVLGLEYPHKRYRLKAQFFSYDPFYSNGVTAISDKQGYSLSGRWTLPKNLGLQTGWLQVHNNLKGILTQTEKENLLNTNLTIPHLIPKSNLWLQAGYSDRIDSSGKTTTGTVYTVGFDSQATDKLNIDGRYSFGDRITLSSTDGLKSGVSLDLGSFYSFGTQIKVNYKMSSAHSLTTSYWRSSSQEQIEISSRYTPEGERGWSNRFEVGDKLDTSKFYIKEYLEFKLNKKGTHRWGIKVRFDEESSDYYVGFYVTLKDLFGVNKEGVSRITESGVTPERGGVQGVVYLDLNGDGHRDKGEPPVANIAILADGKRSALSDKKGVFYIPKRARRDSVELSFDMGALSAIYSPTQGIQKAYWKEGFFTEANLGLTIVSSLSGIVTGIEKEGSTRKFAGVRVLLMQEDKKTIAKDSITANDGSYYIGEILPGHYILAIDPVTIPPEYKQKEPFPDVTISVGKQPTEIENFDIILERKEAHGFKEDASGENDNKTDNAYKRKEQSKVNNKVFTKTAGHAGDYRWLYILMVAVVPYVAFYKKKS